MSKYKDFVSSTGYGKPDGIEGIECRHSHSAFIPGVSTRAITDEELEELHKSDNTPIPYKGREYTKSDALARQRTLETRMRAQRQKIKGLQDGKIDDTLDNDIILARANYQGISQEYREFSLAMGLPEQRQRVTIDGLGSIGKGKVKVDNSVKGGIIKESSKKPITKITDTAIEKVPKVDIKAYTKEQNLFIQQQHKELLQYAKDNNSSNEVAFVYNSSFENIGMFKGTDEKLDFGYSLQGKGDNLLIMHNHPRNSSYSNQDIYLFNTDSIKTMTIVKNNGKIECITKNNDNFNSIYNQMAFDRIIKRYVKTDTTGYAKAINIYLTKLQEKGEITWVKE